MADDSWRTHTFRQSVVAKIDEAIRASGMSTSRNSIEMENHVFQKARNKDEYLGFVARLILHVREMNPKKDQGMGGPGGNQQQPGGPGMQDPINALQNLASQGSRNPMMGGMGGPQQGQVGGPQQPPQQQQQQQQQGAATNLLQTLNRGGPGQGMMMGGMPGNMPTNMPMQGRQNMGMPPNTGPMGPQMVNQMAMQMSNAGMSQMQPNQMQNTGGVVPQMGGAANQMTMGGGGMQPGMGGPMPNQMMGGMSQMAQQKPSPQIMMGTMAQNFPRQPTPNQMYTQSPSPSVQSPAGMSNQQPVPSPALDPSPGGQMSMMTGPPRSVSMAPSPGSSLNTPGGQPAQSPMGGGAMTDEQAYREKVRQLSKYIEPLRKMISRMGNEDIDKMSKMKKLLEILSNPQQRMPLETLIKCEIVLEKIDFKRGDGSVPAPTAPHFREPHVFNSLLEAVGNHLQSNAVNHTLQRTFAPTLDALFGPDIKLVPPLKKARIEEPTSDIPDVLQGEIARLDQRFKVSLDTNQAPGSKTIQLVCCLDDKNLPSVPPISVTVPDDYPYTSPTCLISGQDYDATEFLTNVKKFLEARIKKLRKNFSLSELLNTWELSVRQASSPDSSTSINISELAVLMGF